MIVINAKGARDVRRLKRLAESLDAADVPDLPPAAPVRRRNAASVSTLPSVMISPATREAIMALEPSDLVFGGNYEEG